MGYRVVNCIVRIIKLQCKCYLCLGCSYISGCNNRLLEVYLLNFDSIKKYKYRAIFILYFFMNKLRIHNYIFDRPYFRSSKKKPLLIFFVLFIGIYCNGHTQTYFGFRAGLNASKASFDNEVYKDFYKTKIKPGFTVGALLLFENKEKYGLYTEFNYSLRGKSIESSANDYETNKAMYHFLEIPVLFRVKFKKPKYDWFLQLGPEIKQWLGGKGTFEVYEPDRDIITAYNYTINFLEPRTTSDYMNVKAPNLLQLGLSIGGGLIWDMKNGNYVSFDMRFTIGHTFMGGYESGSIPNIGLVDNFEYTDNVLSLSAVYYFDILEKIRLSKNKYR